MAAAAAVAAVLLLLARAEGATAITSNPRTFSSCTVTPGSSGMYVEIGASLEDGNTTLSAYTQDGNPGTITCTMWTSEPTDVPLNAQISDVQLALASTVTGATVGVITTVTIPDATGSSQPVGSCQGPTPRAPIGDPTTQLSSLVPNYGTITGAHWRNNNVQVSLVIENCPAMGSQTVSIANLRARVEYTVPTTGVATTGVATTGVATTGVATTGVATTGVRRTTGTTGVDTTGTTNVPSSTGTTGLSTGTTGVVPSSTTGGGSPAPGPVNNAPDDGSSAGPATEDEFPWLIVGLAIAGGVVVCGVAAFCIIKRPFSGGGGGGGSDSSSSHDDIEVEVEDSDDGVEVYADLAALQDGASSSSSSDDSDSGDIVYA